MTKPIFTVAIPYDAAREYDKLSKALQTHLKGYHVLCHLSSDKDFKFDLYAPKGYEKYKLKELEDKVSEALL